ncbi:hypothetical protein [Haladaptatus sp. DFWS20]|uniref:hypothetical protein n=1 Tax=Haladaptatus sp. DFWS20 TaxID=3403467 RepID=UPI003EBA55B7
MVSPTGDGSRPAPIDRSILESLQTRLTATQQVEQAGITDDHGQLELCVTFAQPYYPTLVDEATLADWWYTIDDFKIHYQEVHADRAWECRWDRHPNPHNMRDHFHPPPTAPTLGEDASWPADYRDVQSLVLDEIEQRIRTLWNE